MDAMSGIIAENLKRIRKENKWSLDTVSDMTGVSKSMLGQIERGESSPTISTLWKIATGLHISFTGLLEQSEKEAEIISKEEVNPLLSDGGHFRLYPFFPIIMSGNLKCCILNWTRVPDLFPKPMNRERKNLYWSMKAVSYWKQMANAIMWKPAMLSIFRQTDHMSMKTGVTAIHASAC